MKFYIAVLCYDDCCHYEIADCITVQAENDTDALKKVKDHVRNSGPYPYFANTIDRIYCVGTSAPVLLEAEQVEI